VWKRGRSGEVGVWGGETEMNCDERRCRLEAASASTFGRRNRPFTDDLMICCVQFAIDQLMPPRTHHRVTPRGFSRLGLDACILMRLLLACSPESPKLSMICAVVESLSFLQWAVLVSEVAAPDFRGLQVCCGGTARGAPATN